MAGDAAEPGPRRRFWCGLTRIVSLANNCTNQCFLALSLRRPVEAYRLARVVSRGRQEFPEGPS